MPRRDTAIFGGLRRGSKAYTSQLKADAFHARMAVKFGKQNRKEGITLFTEDINLLRNYFNIRRK